MADTEFQIDTYMPTKIVSWQCNIEKFYAETVTYGIRTVIHSSRYRMIAL